MKNQNNQTDNYSKVPPRSIEFEEYILGILIDYDGAILQISGLLKPEAFYKSEHQVIFSVISEMYNKGKAIDLGLLTMECKRRGILDEIGGAFYLTELCNKGGSETNLIHYAKIVHEMYMRRQLILIASKINQQAFDEQYDVQELYSFAQDQIETIQDINPVEGSNSKQVVIGTLKEIEEDCLKVKSGKTAGIPTPLRQLNEAIGGFKSPMFTVLAARPSVGKTSVGLNIARHAAENDYWVSYYSFEMSKEGLMKIIISGYSHVSRVGIRDGRLDERDWSGINSVVDKASDLNINWYDNPDITVNQIRANTHREKKNGKCDLVIIDYLSLISTEGGRSREQDVANISRTLKKITTGIKVPVIALAQLNRNIELRTNKVPLLSDLRESGSIEQDADLVAFLYNETDENEVVTERHLRLAKHRNGTLGDFTYYFDKQVTTMSDHEQYEERFTSDVVPININAGFESRPLDDIPF